MRMYQVVEAESSGELAEKVRRLMLKGWQVAGGVSVVRWEWKDRDGYGSVEWLFFQAMTSTEP